MPQSLSIEQEGIRMKQTPRPASIDQLLDSIKQEYTNRGGSLGTEQNIKEHCRSFFEGQVFLSHTSKDHGFCRKYIVPILDRFGLWSYFFMSVGIANPAIATAYRFMVEYGLYYCKTIIFAVSEASVRSDWVRLEARWAVEQRHPRIVCLVDQTAPEDLHIELGQNCRGSLMKPPQRIIPFDKDVSTAQSVLNRLLHSPAFAHKKRAETF
jgi:hypothetical protein